VGNLPPLLARTVDVDEVVEQWRELRSAAAPPRPPAAVTEEPPSTPARGWWRRLFGG
jgi:hypothetical protein